MQVSLALTHYNRFDLLLWCIEQVKDDPRIGEIVISDDCSTDGSYELLQKRFQQDHKVKLFQNETNLDCYANKRAAVERCSNEWVILFDSDNVLGKDYLDQLYSIEKWDSNVVYCPDYAMPHFNYTPWVGTIRKENVASWMAMPTPRGTSSFCTALNTANYFVSRADYLSVWDGSVNPHTADSIFQIYNWLRSGRSVQIVPWLRYFHRVHDGSHYKQNHKKTGSFAQEVEQKLRQLK